MELAKNVVSTAVIVFMVMAVTSVAFALPVSAQTVSAELMRAWPKWRNLVLSEHPRQILYAKVKNTGTEDAYVRVNFDVSDLFGLPVFYVWTDVVPLPSHPPRPIKLNVTCTCTMLDFGDYVVTTTLYYSADGVNWLRDGRKYYVFTIVH